MNKNQIMNKNYQSMKQDNEELEFANYQEEVKKDKQYKKYKAIVILLTIILYIFGLGLFFNIALAIYDKWPIPGIVVGILLFLTYSICFFLLISEIYVKPTFDLNFNKDRRNINSERKNNIVRWEIANNIVNQAKAINGLYTKKKEEIESLTSLEQLLCKKNNVPNYKSPLSKEVAEHVYYLFRRNGVIYKKAQSLIWKRSISCGALTALSQDAIVDIGIVVVKDMQLIKDLVWLYGFRPTNKEMNALMIKIIKGVCLSIGLNTLPKGTVLASKILRKDSSNLIVQLFGSVLDMGAQFLGNGVMTYLVGRQTILTLIKEYRFQELFRQYIDSIEELEIPTNPNIIKNLNNEIKNELINKSKEEKKETEIINKENIEVVDKKENQIKKKHFFKKNNKNN
ncbi:MAG: DUF697 domain-containing protein [Bacilli bacterium]|nr:DUF697 domain-containing protein [Bacilli bacterium]